MKTRHFKILIFVLSSVIGQLHSQNIRQTLDQNVFSKTIINNDWTAKDSMQIKKGVEIFTLYFVHDTLAIGYFNLGEGLYGSTCKYSVSFKNNFFEIKPKKWEKIIKGSKKIVPIYIYGYLKSSETLFVLFKETKCEIVDTILNDKEWINLSLSK